MAEPSTGASGNLSFGSRAALAAFVGLVIFLILPSQYRLTVTVRGEKAPLVDLLIREGERFTVAYRHSVNGLPVRDVHTIDAGGRIILLEEQFAALSAGMGNWPGHGRLVMRGRDQVIEGIDRPIGEFTLRVGGPEVDHAILFRGHRYELSSLAPGRAVRVSIRRKSPACRLFEMLRTAGDGISHTVHARSSHGTGEQVLQKTGGFP